MNIEIGEFLIAVSAGMVRSATPVLYATLGEIITERSGILNVGLEGIMLVGAFTGVAVTYNIHSIVLGLLAAMLVGLLMGLFHALLCVHFNANQVGTGIAMSIFGTGLSAYLGMDYVGKQINALGACKIPVLSDLPVIGPIFFSHDVLVYLTYLLVPLMAFIINRTRIGLTLRAVGEEPRAAAAAGVNVVQTRYLATAIGAALAGLGGAYLSLAYAQGWSENIAAGRGWIAVGLVLFASWSPFRALIGAYLFGGAISLQLRLQAAGLDVSPYLLGMLPYVLVIVVLSISTWRRKNAPSSVPTALGLPYIPQV